MTTTITANDIDLGFALGYIKCAKNFPRPLKKDAQDLLDTCENFVEQVASNQERERLVEQALNAMGHPDPKVRRYARLERRSEGAEGDELDALLKELDELAEWIYCYKFDC